MQFALVKEERTRPSSGLTGLCVGCRDVLISKCGAQRVHHWAHKGERHCDSWWDNETEWHRNWKNKFPETWQEFRRRASSGEWHIADIFTQHGLTIEFQNSPIAPPERAAREAFYGNMVWILNGSRLRGDIFRFRKVADSFVSIGNEKGWRGVYITSAPEDAFHRDWLHCGAPVFFDFGERKMVSHVALEGNALWCLLPGRVRGYAVLIQVSRAAFVE